MAALNGALSFSTAATSSSDVGTYPITPQGVSSSNYAIAFVNGTLTIVKANTALALAVSPSPSGLNQPVTYSATVAVIAPGAGSPDGVVQFFDGATLVGTAAHCGRIRDVDDQRADRRKPRDLRDVFRRWQLRGKLGSGRADRDIGLDVVNHDAHVLAEPGDSRPERHVLRDRDRAVGDVSGTVAFYDGSTLLGSAAVSSGVAHLTTSSLAAGGHAITARYLGNESVPPSGSTAVAQTVGNADQELVDRAERLTIASGARDRGGADRNGHRLDMEGADRFRAVHGQRAGAGSRRRRRDGQHHVGRGLAHQLAASRDAHGRRRLPGLTRPSVPARRSITLTVN